MPEFQEINIPTANIPMALDLRQIGGGEMCLEGRERTEMAAKMSRRGTFASRNHLNRDTLRQVEKVIAETAFEGTILVQKVEDIDSLFKTIDLEREAVLSKTREALLQNLNEQAELVSDQDILCVIEAICDCARAILLADEFLQKKNDVIRASKAQISFQKMSFAQWLKRKGFINPGAMLQRHSVANRPQQRSQKAASLPKEDPNKWAEKEFEKRGMRASA